MTIINKKFFIIFFFNRKTVWCGEGSIISSETNKFVHLIAMER